MFNAIRLGYMLMHQSDYEYRKVFDTNKYLTSWSNIRLIDNFMETAKKSIQSIVIFDKFEEIIELVGNIHMNYNAVSLIRSHIKSFYQNKMVAIYVSSNNPIICKLFKFDIVINIDSVE